MMVADDFGEFIDSSRQASPPPPQAGIALPRVLQAAASLTMQPSMGKPVPSEGGGGGGATNASDVAAMGAIIGAFEAALQHLRLGVTELCSIYSLDPTRPLDDELAKVDNAEDALQHLGSTVQQFLDRTKTVGQALSKVAAGLSHPAGGVASFRQSRFTSANSWRGEWLRQTSSNVLVQGAAPAAAAAVTTADCSPSVESLHYAESVASLAFTDAGETAEARITRDGEGNKIVNEYQVIGDLGRGSFGKVKLAVHRTTDQVVAIKIMNKSLLRKARLGEISAFDQVCAEIAIMKKLKHRNIVRLYEVIDDPNCNKLYLVMQYVEDGVIHQIDEKTGTCTPLDEEVVKGYTRQLISGLNYLHRHNVIHRDIKPSNLLKSRDGTVYYCDFGVSEVLAGDDAPLSGQKGTFAYFSPELCRGEAAVHGKAVDVWALGVTLYALLIGKLPFFGETVEEVTHKIQNNTLEFPDGTPPLWRSVLGGLLNKDPKRRMTLLELKQHEWLTGSKVVPARSRRMSEFDIVTIDEQDLTQAIAVGNKVRLSSHVTPKERVGKFVRRIRERVHPNDSSPKQSPRQRGLLDEPRVHATWSGAPAAVPAPPSTTPPKGGGGGRIRNSATVTFEEPGGLSTAVNGGGAKAARQLHHKNHQDDDDDYFDDGDNDAAASPVKLNNFVAFADDE